MVIDEDLKLAPGDRFRVHIHKDSKDVDPEGNMASFNGQWLTVDRTTTTLTEFGWGHFLKTPEGYKKWELSGSDPASYIWRWDHMDAIREKKYMALQVKTNSLPDI